MYVYITVFLIQLSALSALSVIWGDIDNQKVRQVETKWIDEGGLADSVVWKTSHGIGKFNFGEQ